MDDIVVEAMMAEGGFGKSSGGVNTSTSVTVAPHRADDNANVITVVTGSMHAKHSAISERELVEGESSQSQSQNTRTSVFQRLNFASVVGKAQTRMLDYYPLEDRKSKVVAIPIELANEENQTNGIKERGVTQSQSTSEGVDKRGDAMIEDQVGELNGGEVNVGDREAINEHNNIDLGAFLEDITVNVIQSDNGKSEQQGLQKEAIATRPSTPFKPKVVPNEGGTKAMNGTKPISGPKTIRGILKTTNRYSTLGNEEGGGCRGGSSSNP
ncbi:hypothetical protein L6452_34969 [Arctium lappa]|uniref:Uncharacterized protein n=1 Tax=Arctium lappa TaxID=4217 RepID=A0ACB8YJN0_ARCLA|nr:hypothetical protein L6452_34969 [Arctium lappa]